MRGRSFVAYRDSGSRWLGRIPDHWTATKLKRVAGMRGGYAFSSDEFTVTGIQVLKIANLYQGRLDLSRSPAFVAPHRVAQLKEFVVQRDDVLLSLTGTFAAVFVGTDGPFLLNQRVGLLQPHFRTYSREFLLNVLSSQEYLNELYSKPTGSAQLNLSNSDVLDIVVTLPPLEEQTQIAKFLDYETAKIDALIEKQQQLIALLKEKRQAVIGHAVTKGLNPDAPMRDSGVEWLGKVPAHWEVVRVRYALRIDNGPRFPINRTERGDMEGEFPYWGPTGIIDHLNEYRYEGDRAIIGEDGDHFLKFAHWPMTHWASGRFNVNNHAHVVDSGPRCSARWFYYAFLHRDIGADVIAQGVSRLKLTREGLSKLILAVPPADEQRTLIVYMEKILTKVSEGLVLAAEQVDLLQERRTALISAAVTGKIDVRAWKPPATSNP